MKTAIMNTVNGIVLQVLLRAMRVLYREDDRVHKEMESWKEGLTLKLVCGPGGPVLAMRRSSRYGVRNLPRAQRTDITMRFKSVRGAFLVLTGQKGVSQAYAEHLFSLEGDIYQTMSFVRCVEYAESYLFPEFWSSRILKEVPGKQTSALKIYLLSLIENVYA